VVIIVGHFRKLHRGRMYARSPADAKTSVRLIYGWLERGRGWAVADPRPARGSRFAAVARLRIDGRKRHTILALIAAFTDAGISDPSINEIAIAAKLPKVAVIRVVDALEADGLIAIKRSPAERNVYELLVVEERP
jgi:hypothetical protein